jgi:hypothetical protein
VMFVRTFLIGLFFCMKVGEHTISRFPKFSKLILNMVHSRVVAIVAFRKLP